MRDVAAIARDVGALHRLSFRAHPGQTLDLPAAALAAVQAGIGFLDKHVGQLDDQPAHPFAELRGDGGFIPPGILWRDILQDIMQMRRRDHLRVVRDPGNHGRHLIGMHPVGFAGVFSLMADSIVRGVGKGLRLGGEIGCGRHVCQHPPRFSGRKS